MNFWIFHAKHTILIEALRQIIQWGFNYGPKSLSQPTESSKNKTSKKLFFGIQLAALVHTQIRLNYKLISLKENIEQLSQCPSVSLQLTPANGINIKDQKPELQWFLNELESIFPKPIDNSHTKFMP